jgi:energy-coupling factor transporter transmembrane protein EcfT
VTALAFHRPAGHRPSILAALARGLALAGVVLVAYWVLPLAWFLLIAAAALVVWSVLVLGADLERYLAMVLLPVALIAGLLAAGWLFLVQPVVDRAEQQVAQLEQLAHPRLPSIPDAGAAVSRAQDAASTATNAAKTAADAAKSAADKIREVKP